MRCTKPMILVLALVLCAWGGPVYADGVLTPAAGGFARMKSQFFTTTGANSFTCPASGIVFATLIGGGGGGGGGLNNASFGGGGGGSSGQVNSRYPVPCTPGATLTVTVGTGGSGGTGGASPAAGSSGWDTSISGGLISTVSARNGVGGSAGIAAGGPGGGGGTKRIVSAPAGATISNYSSHQSTSSFWELYTSGSGGGATASNPGYGVSPLDDSVFRTSTNGGGGSGGCNAFYCDGLNIGGAGTGVGGAGVSATATMYGCGGGGGGGSNGAGGNGGSGAQGVAWLEWFE